MSEENNDKNTNWFWPGGRRQSWMPGIVLILIGGIFLLRNLTGFELENWWALFILFPALGNFAAALSMYRQSGDFHRGVRARLFFGLLFTLLALNFLLDLDLGLLWPVFVILAGIGFLIGAF